MTEFNFSWEVINFNKSFTENEDGGIPVGKVHLFNSDFYFKQELSDF